MTPKPQITRIAAYGLVLQEQRILLSRVSASLPSSAGSWTLPGGGLDFGEHPEDAMIREVEEETGMLVQAKGLADIDSFYSEHEDHVFHWLRIIYQTELMGGKLSYEVDGSTDYCAWWTFEESQALDLVELAKHGLKLAFPQQNEA